MQLFLAAAPEHIRTALQYTSRIAHAAYRIGREGRLVGRDLLGQARGGLMLLSDRDCAQIPDPGLLSQDVWRECAVRNFGGMAADFEAPVCPERVAFLQKLAPIFRRNGKSLYVPEAYGRQVPQAAVLVCTALSGGTLEQRLREAADAFGPGRLALDLQRLRMSFPLPCPTGCGEPLEQEELAALLADRPCFYSGDLCAKYFTLTQGGRSRFVLFDDADTLQRKIRLGSSLGAGAGFLMYPEVSDLLPRLFPEAKHRRRGDGGR